MLIQSIKLSNFLSFDEKSTDVPLRNLKFLLALMDPENQIS